MKSPIRRGPRYASAATVAEGWTLERVTAPSRLFAANGIRTGSDGRIYVAQVTGSQIDAIDPTTGEIETISPQGGEIVGPDDLAFDDEGNLYATEITEGRVSMLTPQGTTRVICGDIPIANPITCYQGRVIAGECRPGARILELDRNGGSPRVILDNVPMANAFEVGPDGKLYFPVMGTNEIWRVDLAGGRPEVVARDLGVPDSVKFDASGFIVSTQVASGEVLRINPQTGERTTLARIAAGLDNCTFVGNRLFVSSITGEINEILGEGRVEPLIAGGLQGPLGVAVNTDGELFVADGGFTYIFDGRGEREIAGMLFSPGFPGYTRGVCGCGSGEWVVTTANGTVVRYWPRQHASEVLASGYDELYGVAVTADKAIVFADRATGRLLGLRGGAVAELAAGLRAPTGVAVGPGDVCYVSESAGGCVTRISAGKARTVLDGLSKPEGLALVGDTLYVLDSGAKTIIACDTVTRAHRRIASDLPVGAPQGVAPKPLRSFLPLCGAMGPFADIAAALDGSLYLSADAEGSILAIRPGALR
jgi:sugar lactone lactonase YvrE